MQGIESQEEQVFWSDTYRGRPISTFYRHGRWHVYVDHVFQHNMLFASAQDAISWLIDRIDRGFGKHVH
jgi:hypothetical protein